MLDFGLSMKCCPRCGYMKFALSNDTCGYCSTQTFDVDKSYGFSWDAYQRLPKDVAQLKMDDFVNNVVRNGELFDDEAYQKRISMILQKKEEQSKNQFVPKCPTCGSPYIEKISTGNKIASVAMFGVLATGHVSKTFRCNSCGYKW